MDPASITNHIVRPQKIEKVTMEQQDPPIIEFHGTLLLPRKLNNLYITCTETFVNVRGKRSEANFLMATVYEQDLISLPWIKN